MGNNKSKIKLQQHRKNVDKIIQHTSLPKQSSIRVETNKQYWVSHIRYFTLNDCQFKTNIWQLYADSIKIYEKDPYGPEIIKEILLSSIVKVKQTGLDAKDIKQDHDLKYLFLLETNENEIYFCGDRNREINDSMNELVRRFFDMFKMVYLPYENKSKHIYKFKIDESIISVFKPISPLTGRVDKPSVNVKCYENMSPYSDA